MKKILIAPVPITPTKPLTPSHLKGVLWVDVLLKATSRIAEVACHYSPLVALASDQTVGFWEFLDRCHADVDFAHITEEQIGEYYIRYHSEKSRPSIDAISPYLSALESGHWLHPVSRRLNEIWSSQFTAFGAQQFLQPSRPLALPVDELIDRLAEKDLCIDLRASGGALYLDLTDEGLPLRQAITREGRPNYLVSFLRELVPLVPNYDHFVLVHDEGLDADYFLLQRILSRLGADVCRIPLTRVAIDGVVQSARHGGWQGYTASALVSHSRELDIDSTSFQLGARFYLVGVLGKSRKLSFNMADLDYNIARARRLAATAPDRDCDVTVESFLKRCTIKQIYVDPFKVTSSLMSRRSGSPFPSRAEGGWYI